MKLFSYSIQVLQSLGEASKDKVDFVVSFWILEENPSVLQIVWFTAEVHFNLNDFVNEQNVQVWAIENPHELWGFLHPQKCTVLCTALVHGIIGPSLFFLDTVYADCCCCLHVL